MPSFKTLVTSVLPGRQTDRVLLVTDRAGWILDEVADHLCANLPTGLRPLVVTDQWRRARSCQVHFVNRTWAWADGVLDGVDASNRLIGIWWHGRADSPYPGIQAALQRTRRLHDRFWRMQATCAIGRNALLACGVPLEKIVTLPEGIALDRFSVPVLPAERQRRRAVCGIDDDEVAIGSFQKDGEGWGDGFEPKLIKGPDVFVETLTRLRQRYPVRAVIPGPARGYVRRRLEQAGVPCSAPGAMSRGALIDLYATLDLYVSPSRDEGGPAGVLESMASGVPVVSTRAGMPADMIDDGVNGGLTDVDDIDGLVDRCATAIEQRSVRERWVSRARETVRPLDWRVLGQRYATELYGAIPA